MVIVEKEVYYFAEGDVSVEVEVVDQRQDFRLFSAVCFHQFVDNAKDFLLEFMALLLEVRDDELMTDLDVFSAERRAELVYVVQQFQHGVLFDVALFLNEDWVYPKGMEGCENAAELVSSGVVLSCTVADGHESGH